MQRKVTQECDKRLPLLGIKWVFCQKKIAFSASASDKNVRKVMKE
jgi:hypothetical protein